MCPTGDAVADTSDNDAVPTRADRAASNSSTLAKPPLQPGHGGSNGAGAGAGAGAAGAGAAVDPTSLLLVTGGLTRTFSPYVGANNNSAFDSNPKMPSPVAESSVPDWAMSPSARQGAASQPHGQANSQQQQQQPQSVGGAGASAGAAAGDGTNAANAGVPTNAGATTTVAAASTTTNAATTTTTTAATTTTATSTAAPTAAPTAPAAASRTATTAASASTPSVTAAATSVSQPAAPAPTSATPPVMEGGGIAAAAGTQRSAVSKLRIQKRIEGYVRRRSSGARGLVMTPKNTDIRSFHSFVRARSDTHALAAAAAMNERPTLPGDRSPTRASHVHDFDRADAVHNTADIAGGTPAQGTGDIVVNMGGGVDPADSPLLADADGTRTAGGAGGGAGAGAGVGALAQRGGHAGVYGGLGRAMSRHPSIDESQKWDMDPTLLEYLVDPLDITILERIGGGAAGAVYRGLHYGGDVAIKTLSTSSSMLRHASRLLARETAVVARISHPNIVELVGILMDPPLTCVVLEVRLLWVSGDACGAVWADSQLLCLVCLFLCCWAGSSTCHEATWPWC